MKPWHMRIGAYGRAFVPAPRGPWLAVVLFLRGWRPFESLCVSRGRWWSVPSPNTRRMYPQPMAIWWNGSPQRREGDDRRDDCSEQPHADEERGTGMVQEEEMKGDFVCVRLTRGIMVDVLDIETDAGTVGRTFNYGSSARYTASLLRELADEVEKLSDE